MDFEKMAREIAAVLCRTEYAIKQRGYKLLGTTLDRDPIERNGK